MKEIIEISLDERYNPEVKGLGEIYEIASVSYCQKRLQKKYLTGRLFLSSNFHHSQRGLTLVGLNKLVIKKGYQVLEKGYTDSSLFPSLPRSDNNLSPLLKVPGIINFARIFFYFLVRLEFIWKGETSSHMIFCFGQKIKYNQKKYG